MSGIPSLSRTPSGVSNGSPAMDVGFWGRPGRCPVHRGGARPRRVHHRHRAQCADADNPPPADRGDPVGATVRAVQIPIDEPRGLIGPRLSEAAASQPPLTKEHNQKRFCHLVRSTSALSTTDPGGIMQTIYDIFWGSFCSPFLDFAIATALAIILWRLLVKPPKGW